jgi:hypothetical protein
LTEEIRAEYRRFVHASKRYEEAGDTGYAESAAKLAEDRRAKYIKRTKIDPATGEKITNKAAKAARLKSVKCGYCSERGHTRRTCETVKRDFQVFVAATKGLRERELVAMREVGAGVGSLVPVRHWNGSKEVSYVAAIGWAALDAHRTSLRISYVPAKRLDLIAQPWSHTWMGATSLARAVNDSPDACSLVDKIEPPAGWLEGDDLTLNDAFPSKGTKDAISRPWSYRYPPDDFIDIIIELGLQEHYQIS